MRGLETGTVRLSETLYAPGLRIPRHAHETPQMCFVVRGGYLEEVGGARVDSPASTLLYHAADVPHRNEFPGHETLCLNVAFRCDSTFAGLFEGLGGHAVARSGAHSWHASRLVRELDIQDDLSGTAVESLLAGLLCDLARAPGLKLREGTRPPVWLERVRSRLEEEFAERPSLAELAADASVHSAHLTRAFRRYYGCAVGEFVRARRVEEACRLLRDTDLTICAVAHSTGFADQSHLTRVFRLIVGVTPARYRSLPA